MGKGVTFDGSKNFSEWLLRFLFLFEPSTSIVISELFHCNGLLRLLFSMMIGVLVRIP